MPTGCSTPMPWVLKMIFKKKWNFDNSKFSDKTIVRADGARRKNFEIWRRQRNNAEMAATYSETDIRLHRYQFTALITMNINLILMNHFSNFFLPTKQNNDFVSLILFRRWRYWWRFGIAAMFPILGLFLASPALPKILDFIKPLNETRDLIYLYETEYFVDQREYYLPILLHYYLSVPISVGGIVFFDNMLGTFIHHECAMLEILRFLSIYLQLMINF